MIGALELSGWDWAFIGWFLAVTLGIGLYYSKRASAGLSEYFLSGRKLPWWALGTSMVATTFAADTPIAVAGFVVAAGVAKNWVWWSFLFGGTLTVFVFSRWWRRAEVVTEIELIDRRYDGGAARALRGFKAIYLGLVLNAITFGWVTNAMVNVCEVVFDIRPALALAVLLALTFVYTMLSGLWGVVATDVLQFAMALLGAILLAVLSVVEVGGLGELVRRVGELDPATLEIFPTGWGTLSMTVSILVLVNWWAVYYPGAEPGGGGYVTQRMSAALDEDHARKGTLWFIFAHYAVRPWPWIIVGLAAIALEPRFFEYARLGEGVAPPADLDEFHQDKAYPYMFQFLPVGILGLVVASFLAAFMSTITTTLNLSASYLVNDFYLPFVRRGDDERGRVLVARVAVAVVAAVGSIVAWQMTSVAAGWGVLMQLTAGTGPVLILRWLWWRVNAWSEISAMIASAIAFIFARVGVGEWLAQTTGGPKDELQLVFIAATSVAVWVPVTFATQPASRAKLRAFYERVRPGGWWSSVPDECQLPRTLLGRELRMWIASTAMIFGALLGLGSLLLLDTMWGVIWVCIAVAGAVGLRMGFQSERAEREAAQ